MPADAHSALATDRAYLALGNETFEAEGALFVRNRDLPVLWDANHVTRITARTPEDVDRLLARADVEHAASPHRRFDVEPSSPPALEARLVLLGWHRSETLLMGLDGPLRR